MVNNLKRAITDFIAGRAPALTTLADLRDVEGFSGDVSHYMTSTKLGFDVLVAGDVSPGALKALDEQMDEKVIEAIACSPIFYTIKDAQPDLPIWHPDDVGESYPEMRKFWWPIAFVPYGLAPEDLRIGFSPRNYTAMLYPGPRLVVDLGEQGHPVPEGMTIIGNNRAGHDINNLIPDHRARHDIGRRPPPICISTTAF